MKKKVGKAAFSLAKTSVGSLIVGIAFGKLSRLLPVKKIKDTKYAIAFWHPKPHWERHILIVPKKSIKSVAALRKGDSMYIAGMFKVAKDIVKELGWESKGYSLIINGGKRQEVGQLHMHLSRGKRV